MMLGRVLSLACFFAIILPPRAMADERILSFDSHIEVQKNGDLLVTETIKVRAEGNEIRRGIYRDIPRLHRTKWGLKLEKPFKVVSVRQNDQAANYEVEKIGKGGVRIRIGRADEFLEPGVYTYEITYRTGRQLYLEEERDALYWNVNGTEWGFPIDQVTATLVLPKGVEATKVWGYTGKRGEEGEDYKAEITEEGAVFRSTRPFGPKENLTIVAEWLPGLLDPVAYEKGRTSLLRDHPLVVLAGVLMVGAIGYYIGAWFLVGRDPAKGVIIPHYEPPPGFSPAAARYLDRMGFDNTCFSAGVMGLAAKGVATIDKNGKAYTLVDRGTDQKKEPLCPDEVRLYNRLLASGSIELKQKNHKTIGDARSALQKMLSSKLEKTHFSLNLRWWLPGLLLTVSAAGLLLFATGTGPPALFLLVWLSIWTVGTTALLSRCISLWKAGSVGPAIGATLFAIPFSAAWIGGTVALAFTAGLWASIAFVVGGVLNVLFYHLIKAPTHLGRRIMDHIEGFRRYLSVAEEDRLNLRNPPDKTPELFEKFLPYAHALDCEQQWSEKFEEVLRAAGTAPGQQNGGYRPSFYSGSYTGMDRAMGAAAIGGALTGALASSSSAPSSGGSGGGGSSGGGGGGGGGGGW